MINPDLVWGNKELLYRTKTAFLSSHAIPPEKVSAVGRWADTLSPDNDCIMCGNIQRIESELLQKLIYRHIPIIVVFGIAMPQTWTTEFLRAADAKCLAMVCSASPTQNSHFIDKADDARRRNMYMIANADNIVVGYARPCGKLSQQLCGLSNVRYL